MEKKTTKKTKVEKECKSCYGKRYYTVMFGFHGAPDFVGDRGFDIKPKIYKIACPTCNYNNKLKMVGVHKNQWNIEI